MIKQLAKITVCIAAIPAGEQYVHHAHGISNNNREKHGIDFYEIQALWNDPDFIEIPVKSNDETRFLVIGNISEKHWSAVITYRNEKVRIISVCRSGKEEVKIYES